MNAMIIPPKITPFVWYDCEAQEAAEFYVSLIPDSRIVDVRRQGEAAFVVSFELAGVRLTALNGGAIRPHAETLSIAVTCDDQAEVDRLWAVLTDGGKENQCGWLVDRFGLSCQVVPKQSQRVMQAMMGMVKFEVAALEVAFAG
jgi:predicted 3-demethylubiquinone-9 3-methyltransferase (glyoxalase superfamily)